MINKFKDKKVLITGHTGFKGSWLSLVMHTLGAKVYGISIDDLGDNSHYRMIPPSVYSEDIRMNILERDGLIRVVKRIEPDFVFHLAAQPLVGYSYREPTETFETNAIGSMNVAEALRHLDNNCVAVFVTSDKAYENLEWDFGYREIDRLGGKDPYSASKACAEILIRSYFESFLSARPNIRLGIGRAGNVIGGGDWAENRIIPDAFRSWSTDTALNLRSPESTRPWQHVLEPLFGYINLAMDLESRVENNGEAFNFGPKTDANLTVNQLIKAIGKQWGGSSKEVILGSNELFKEAGLLNLNCDKAHARLSWKPVWNIENTIYHTTQWYNEVVINNRGIDVTQKQINQYIEDYVRVIVE